MTTATLKTLQCFVLLSAMAISFSSCLKDDCKQFYTYQLYKPVYMSYDDLRAAVKSSAITDMKNIGKIYYKAPYIFLSEVDKGIHVLDNTNPSSPQNIAFINVPGNLDIAIKDNVLYADSYIDLVGIDISDPNNAKEIWRDQNVFPQRNYNGWFADGTKGVVTDWIESDTTIEEDCSNTYPIRFEGDLFYAATSGGTNTTSGAPGNGVAGSLARFAISSDYLYCIANPSLLLFNIQNANQPVDNGLVSGWWNAETLFPYNQYLFVGSTTGVSIYNNYNPSSPSLISTVTHVTGCDPVVVEGNYAYSTIHAGNMCGQSFNEMNVIDITNISNPVIAKTYDLANPYGVGIDGKNLFVCDDLSGLKMYDASDPTALILKQTVQAGETRDVIPLGGILLLISTDGLYEFDYSSGTLNQLSFTPISK
ncbi:MAG TPA: hypothetical protein VE978_25405 [Chitinophagales bacterium]|nr:hypothetical protein [Chitinophagales bacterium]